MTSIIADNITSPLGWTTSQNMQALYQETSGLTFHYSDRLNLKHHSAIIKSSELNALWVQYDNGTSYTKLEQLSIHSISDALGQTQLDIAQKDVLFVFATVKGNIELLDRRKETAVPFSRRYLFDTALAVSEYFKNPNPPIVISNACISGVLAIITGKRILESQSYKHVVVVGCDVISDFTLSGFNALKAMSLEMCKPFDKDRKGINLGEACGTIILSSELNGTDISLKGGSVSNDANHMSGPSRTGEGMYQVINNSIKDIDLPIDYISAHGTGTLFNDDMESIAISRHNLTETPTNSLKGYWGHTLGAAGIIESIATYHSILDKKLILSKGCEEKGTVQEINIIQETTSKSINCALKIAAGFGGCNASIIFKKASNGS